MTNIWRRPKESGFPKDTISEMMSEWGALFWSLNGQPAEDFPGPASVFTLHTSA